MNTPSPSLANDNGPDDWADKLARQVLIELGQYRGEAGVEVMAARLRDAHELGRLDGLGLVLDRIAGGRA